MKIGLFFGTFDPIHYGHLTIAQSVLNKKLVDQVWLIVTPQSPFKKNRLISSKEHRFNLINSCTKKFQNIFASDYEFQLPSPQYTYKTLANLVLNYKDDHEFCLILGSDNYLDLLNNEWQNSSFILQKFQIGIYIRAGYKLNKTSHANLLERGNFLIPGEVLSISSSDVREIMEAYYKSNNLEAFEYYKRFLKNLIPIEVFKYIDKHNLYNF